MGRARRRSAGGGVCEHTSCGALPCCGARVPPRQRQPCAPACRLSKAGQREPALTGRCQAGRWPHPGTPPAARPASGRRRRPAGGGGQRGRVRGSWCGGQRSCSVAAGSDAGMGCRTARAGAGAAPPLLPGGGLAGASGARALGVKCPSPHARQSPAQAQGRAGGAARLRSCAVRSSRWPVGSGGSKFSFRRVQGRAGAARWVWRAEVPPATATGRQQGRRTACPLGVGGCLGTGVPPSRACCLAHALGQGGCCEECGRAGAGAGSASCRPADRPADHCRCSTPSLAALWPVPASAALLQPASHPVPAPASSSIRTLEHSTRRQERQAGMQGGERRQAASALPGGEVVLNNTSWFVLVL